MSVLSSMSGVFIAGILMASLTSCNSIRVKADKVPPGFDIVKGSADDTDGWASEIRHIATGIEMVYVAPGKFIMGAPADEEGRGEIQHPVKLTRGYYIGKYEVTQEQWEKVTGVNPSLFKGANKPVDWISWTDCQEFCRKLGSGVRLPTEAEWEYAARGGNKSLGYKIYSGSDNLDEVAWFSDNSERKTHEVGQKKPNELGLYDMSGNAWEFCEDWYDNYPKGEVTDPVAATAGPLRVRVLRGGSSHFDSRHCRSAYREMHKPDRRGGERGFRLAMDIPVQK